MFRQLCILWVCGLAVGMPAAQPAFVRAYDSRFEYEGRAFRFVGFNLRNLINYGTWDPAGGASRLDDIDTNLQAAANIGARVIRCFVALSNSTTDTQINRLGTVLNKVQALNLKAIPVLIDLYSAPSGPWFHPPGDSGYYEDIGGYFILNDAWFASGYKLHYKPFAEAMVNAFRDHPAIFAWELGNELKDAQNPTNIIPFVHDMAARIKQLDPNHMVSAGFLSWDHQGLSEEEGLALYQDPNLDFITVHTYDGGMADQNYTIYARLAKPLIVEEFGWQGSDRVTPTRNALAEYFEQKQVQGFMHWAFQAQDRDIADGDNVYGIDRYTHGNDYDAMTALYEDWASTLTLRNEPLLQPKPALHGSNIALQSQQAMADSILNNAAPAYAIDGDASTGSKWTSEGTAPPHWLALDLGRSVRVEGFKVKMAGLDEWYIFSFEAFEIQMGPAVTGPWTTLISVDNPAQFAAREIVLDTATPLRFVRLLITDPGVDNYARLPEFEVYEARNGAQAVWGFYP